MSDDVVIQNAVETVHLADLDVRVINFDLSTANVVQEFNQVGTYGSLNTSSKVGELTITLTFDILSDDKLDFELARLRLLELFATPGAFYIWSTRTPFIRWKVVLQGTINIPRYENSDIASNDVTVNLICPTGYAESTATTLDLMTTDVGEWGLGMKILTDPKPTYQFTSSSFQFNNLSNIPLLAEDHPVKIHFQGVVNKSLTIKNNTTGQSLVINHTLKSSDKLDIEGLVPYVNGSQIYKDSNHSYLDFMKGNNDIAISGASNFSISFETRFYY